MKHKEKFDGCFLKCNVKQQKNNTNAKHNTNRNVMYSKIFWQKVRRSTYPFYSWNCN